MIKFRFIFEEYLKSIQRCGFCLIIFSLSIVGSNAMAYKVSLLPLDQEMANAEIVWYGSITNKKEFATYGYPELDKILIKKRKVLQLKTISILKGEKLPEYVYLPIEKSIFTDYVALRPEVIYPPDVRVLLFVSSVKESHEGQKILMHRGAGLQLSSNYKILRNSKIYDDIYYLFQKLRADEEE